MVANGVLGSNGRGKLPSRKLGGQGRRLVRGGVCSGAGRCCLRGSSRPRSYVDRERVAGATRPGRPCHAVAQRNPASQTRRVPHGKPGATYRAAHDRAPCRPPGGGCSDTAAVGPRPADPSGSPICVSSCAGSRTAQYGPPRLGFGLLVMHPARPSPHTPPGFFSVMLHALAPNRRL